MNARRHCVQQRRAACFAFCLAWLFAAAPAAAQKSENVNAAALVAARELFHEATLDVDAGRYAVALEKFRRVAGVKETAAVRFNIAKCEQALGKIGTALVEYELAQREAEGDPKGDEVARLAREHAERIRTKVPRLVVDPPANPPPGLSVTIDGASLSNGALGVPLPLDPGLRVVDAKANGATFHQEVQLEEGQSLHVVIELHADAPVAPPSPPPAAHAEATPPDKASPASSRKTWGIVAMGAGAALLGTAGVLTLVHNGHVSDLKAACDPTCPSERAGELGSLRSRALTEQTLAIAFGIGGVAFAGVGAYLVFAAPHAAVGAPKGPSAWLAVGAPFSTLGMSTGGSF